MKYKHEKPNNPDHALTTAVISAFRSINPSYDSAHTWYTHRQPAKARTPLLSKPIKSKYYVPLFGSVFASALALVMILTSQNNPLPTGNVAFNTNSTETLSKEARIVSTFSTNTTEITPTVTNKKQVLAKIDAQSQSTSRTQADESFTDSLNVETSLQDLFE